VIDLQGAREPVTYDTLSVIFDHSDGNYDARLVLKDELLSYPGWWCTDWKDVVRVAEILQAGLDPGVYD